MSILIERSGVNDFNDRFANPRTSLPRSSFSFGRVLTAVSRNFRGFFICILLCELVGVLAILLIPVSYVASTQVLLEPLPRKPIAIASDGIADPLDSAQADSRMHVAKSERLLRYVFVSVDWPSLIARPDAKKENSVIASALSWLNFFKPRAPESDEVKQTKTFMDFTNRVSVKRLGLSYVIEISFQAETPRTAMFMANAITAAYLRNLVAASQLEGELLERRITTIHDEEQILKAAIKKGEIPDESFPDANARVISAAILPVSKAAPKSALILLMATSTGLALGILLSVLKLQNDAIIRDGSEAFPGFGLRHLATLRDPGQSGSRLKGGPPANIWPIARKSDDCQALIAKILEPSDLKRHKIIGFVARESRTQTSSVVLDAARRLAAVNYDPVMVEAEARPLASSVEANGRVATEIAIQSSDMTTGDEACVRQVDAIDVFPLRALFSSPCPATNKVRAALLRLSKKGPVLVDLPALEASFDANVLARYVDEIVLVASAHRTRLDELVGVAEQLPMRKIAGFVLLTRSRQRTFFKFNQVGKFAVWASSSLVELGRRWRPLAWHSPSTTQQAPMEGPLI